MTYNKAREEKIWILQKTREEKLLRELGVSEDIIQELHRYDWELFKRERSFLEKQYTNNSFEDYRLIDNFKMNNDSLDDILNQLDNEKLYRIISLEDEKTLEIIYLKIIGYSNKEISEIIGLNETSIHQRLYKLRKK